MKLSRNIYQIPFVGKVDMKPAPSHYEVGLENAVDFALKIGTPILASFDGIIEQVVDVYGEGKHDKKYLNRCNFVIIKHDNKEYSIYAHLLKGVEVREMQKVVCGQLIGYCGLSGFTSYPHLHYQTSILKHREYISIPTRFRVGNRIKVLVSPRE